MPCGMGVQLVDSRVVGPQTAHRRTPFMGWKPMEHANPQARVIWLSHNSPKARAAERSLRSPNSSRVLIVPRGIPV